MATLTVIILAKNEEQHMKDCIASAQFADEVLLIDDGSTDKTVEIAESMGARVVHHAMNGDWSQQRRFAVEEARSEWIFFLDADERISPELQREVQDVLAKNDKKAYWIERSNVFHHNKACCVPITCYDSCQKKARILKALYTKLYPVPILRLNYMAKCTTIPMIIGISISINSTIIRHWRLRNIRKMGNPVPL